MSASGLRRFDLVVAMKCRKRAFEATNTSLSQFFQDSESNTFRKMEQ